MKLTQSKDLSKGVQTFRRQEVTVNLYTFVERVIKFFTLSCDKYYKKEDIDFLVTTFINLKEGRNSLLDKESLLLYSKRDGINERAVKYRLKKFRDDFTLKYTDEDQYSLPPFIMESINFNTTNFIINLDYSEDGEFIQ